MKAKRQERLDSYTSFKEGLKDYISLYLSEKGRLKRSTISHRLSLCISKHFPPIVTSEIDYIGADIVLRDSSGKILVILLWSSDYLSEKNKGKAQNLHLKKNPILTLAFSFMKDKDYILLYRFENDFIEYIHLSKIDFSENVVRRIKITKESKNENDEQLMLTLDDNKKDKKTNKNPKRNKAQ